MKRIVILHCGVMALLVFQSGCSNITVLRVQELKQVQAHVDSLKMELIALQERALKEQKKQNEMLRLIRAEQQVRFAELERNMSALAGNISESQERLSKIDEKTYEIKKRWEEKARLDSLTRISETAEIENLFEIAHNDFIAGRYDISLSGFQDLINRFPDSPQAEESYYWIAECHYVRRKYNDAERQYKDYIKNYGNGKKVCVALYKLGLIYEEMKKEKSKNMVWKKLINQCPDSDEAEGAKARM